MTKILSRSVSVTNSSPCCWSMAMPVARLKKPSFLATVSDNPSELAVRIEDENFPAEGIGHIDIVLGIDGNTDRG